MKSLSVDTSEDGETTDSGAMQFGQFGGGLQGVPGAQVLHGTHQLVFWSAGVPEGGAFSFAELGTTRAALQQPALLITVEFADAEVALTALAVLFTVRCRAGKAFQGKERIRHALSSLTRARLTVRLVQFHATTVFNSLLSSGDSPNRAAGRRN